MERYTKKYSGILAGMVKSDTGDWCKYEEASATIDHNSDVLFDVIKERNVEIEKLKAVIEETNALVTDIYRLRETDLKENQSDSMQNFSYLQNAIDVLGVIKLRILNCLLY